MENNNRLKEIIKKAYEEDSVAAPPTITREELEEIAKKKEIDPELCDCAEEYAKILNESE